MTNRPVTPSPLSYGTGHCKLHRIQFASLRIAGSQINTCPACLDRELINLTREGFRAISGLQGMARFERATFDNYVVESPRQRRVVDACKALVAGIDRSTGKTVWLTGTPGSGKTHLGCAMVNALVDRSTPASAGIFPVRQLVSMVMRTWDQTRRRDPSDQFNFVTEAQAVESLAAYRLLVLDDIESSFGAEVEQEVLFSVVDKRYQRRLPTVLISHMTVPAICASLGPRLTDRLQEGAEVFACTWPSHRTGPVTRRLEDGLL